MELGHGHEVRAGRPGRRPRSRGWGHLALTLAVIAGLGAGLITGSGSAARLAARAVSPAEGHAAVIAQGVAPMPRVEVGWRVISMAAQPLDDAPFAERSLGFVLADDGAVLVEDEAAGARTLLNPGEAVLAHQGARQRRASLTDAPAAYYAIELVVAEDLENEATIGSGDLLFAGEPFVAPRGERDLDLVRDVLEADEVGELATDAPALILVTEGELTIVSDEDEATLAAGEAGIFSGDIELESDEGGVYVAAVIGDRAPSGRSAPERAATDTGTFAITTYACPAGMTIETLETDGCSRADESLVDWELSGEVLDEPLTSRDAAIDGPTTTWNGLPEGEYFLDLTAAGYAAGYVDYFIPSSNEVTRQDEATTRIFYDSDRFRGSVRAYVFAAQEEIPAGEGGIVLLTESCPPGTTLPDIQVTPCDRVLDGFEVILTGDSIGGALTEADSGAGDAVYWAPLPFGTYTITFTALPDGHDVFYVFGSAGASAHVLGDGTGFTFTLDADLAAADPYYDDEGTVQLYAIFVSEEREVES